MTEDPLIEARGLVKDFTRPRGAIFAARSRPVRAVDHVSFAIARQRTLALVGESGCGKTTTARMVLLLENPTAGDICFKGQPVIGGAIRGYRASVQAVFQDPWSSLNPRMRVAKIVAEPLRLNTNMSGAERQRRVAETLEEVGLEATAAGKFPHEFSGGQRQRIAIARAIILHPQAIILDEPVSALDVSVRLQIINLLADAQRRLGMSYLLISHDLATVRYQADAIAVMYQGAIVEHGDSEGVFNAPLHPYTRALFEAARFVMPGSAQPEQLDDVIETGIQLPGQGCRFVGRCPHAMPICRTKEPVLVDAAAGHAVACHLHQ
jgi:oligopeptide/dipeptide ABC transporter ATP-binding protein